MTSIAEKLRQVREAEEKAKQIREVYANMAAEIIQQAREEARRLREREEAKARVEGEAEMEEIVKHAMQEAEELRVEYMFDRAKLLAEVAKRRRRAVEFLLRKLEEGA